MRKDTRTEHTNSCFCCLLSVGVLAEVFLLFCFYIFFAACFRCVTYFFSLTKKKPAITQQQNTTFALAQKELPLLGCDRSGDTRPDTCPASPPVREDTRDSRASYRAVLLACPPAADAAPNDGFPSGLPTWYVAEGCRSGSPHNAALPLPTSWKVSADTGGSAPPSPPPPSSRRPLAPPGAEGWSPER